jgi:hypothetical protein
MIDLIKNKKLFIFILFTFVLFVTSFKKLVEGSSQYTNMTEENEDYKDKAIEKRSASNPLCLSVRCNRPLNINFNETNGKTYDEGGDLAAYCCIACRDSGGHEHGDQCNINGGICNESTVEGMISGGGNDNCDGIIDNGQNICYATQDNSEMLQTPSFDNPESCGANSFYKCFQDPDCVNYMNNIHMSSYEEHEPQDNTKWQSNITNMLKFNHFNDLNNNTDEDGVVDKTLNGNFCQELCIKSRDEDNPPDNDNAYALWVDLHNRIQSDDYNISNTAVCEKSNAVWRSQMLCNGCKTLINDEDGNNILTTDPNYRKISCHPRASYNNTKEIQDKQSIKHVDQSGNDIFRRFVESKDAAGIYGDLALVDDDIQMAVSIQNAEDGQTGWVEGNRTINDIEFGCRLNCAYDMHDNCFSGNPNNDEINTIKNQCRKACDKRLPAWVYYSGVIGNGDEVMQTNNGWLNVDDTTPETWSRWRDIFSPDV